MELIDETGGQAMNERIKELVEQATTTFDFGAPINFFDKEKFAELIVRECAEIAKTAEPYRSDDLILRHFGVIDDPTSLK